MYIWHKSVWWHICVYSLYQGSGAGRVERSGLRKDHRHRDSDLYQVPFLFLLWFMNHKLWSSWLSSFITLLFYFFVKNALIVIRVGDQTIIDGQCLHSCHHRQQFCSSSWLLNSIVLICSFLHFLSSVAAFYWSTRNNQIFDQVFAKEVVDKVMEIIYWSSKRGSFYPISKCSLFRGDWAWQGEVSDGDGFSWLCPPGGGEEDQVEEGERSRKRSKWWSWPGSSTTSHS